MTSWNRSLAASLLLLPALLLAACGGGSSSSSVSLSSVAVTPASVPLAVGATQQLTATGTYSDSTTAVLADAVWASDATAVATVSATGLVTARAAGTAHVSATSGGKSGSATVTVTGSTGPTANQIVFYNGAYGSGVAFQGFDGSVNAVTIDTATTLPNGHAALKVVCPASGYTGGAFVDTSAARNLTAYDAVTFWAKASAAVTIEKVGLGDNNGASSHNGFKVERLGLALTTTWQKFTVPIPLASKLTASDGLFHFADGANHSPVVFWLADVQYEALGSGVIGAPAPTWLKTAVSVATGATYQVLPADLKIDYTIGGAPVTLAAPSVGYFTFTSDGAAVGLSATGLITGASAGSANVTASLGSVASANKLAVTVTGSAVVAPAAAPTAPTQAAGAGVISLYSATYASTASDQSAKVETWLTSWSGGGSTVNPYVIAGTSHEVKKYELKNYIGVEFIGGNNTAGDPNLGTKEIDLATPGMTHFHMDVWTPDGSHLVIKLIDAGPDKIVGTGDDSTKITMGGITLSGQSQWIALDLDIGALAVQQAAWTGKNIAQIVIALDAPSAGGTMFVDNVYFYKASGGGGGGGGGPTVAPAAPTATAANVMSLFSATYTGGTAGGDYSGKVDSYNATCFGPSGSSVSDYTITGTSHVLKRYSAAANTFAIIELIGATGGTASPPDTAICHGGNQSTSGATLIDVTAMTGFRFNVWSPAGSTAGTNIQIVSTDGTNTIAGPGQATGASMGTSYASGTTPIAAGQWVTIDFPFSSSGPPGAPAGLTKVGLVKIFFMDAGTYYLDNVYFYK